MSSFTYELFVLLFAQDYDRVISDNFGGFNLGLNQRLKLSEASCN
jgi:hypothetical protein